MIALKIILGVILYLLGVSFVMSLLCSAVHRVNERKDRRR